MFINSFIYFHIEICILIIIFEISWKKYIIIRDKKIGKEKVKLKNKIIGQIEKYEERKQMSRHHFIMMENELKKTNNLISFEKACDEISKYKNMESYFKRMIPIFEDLAKYYSEKSKGENKAYFATIIKKYYKNFENKERLEKIISIFYEFLESDSIYCKINTIDLICQIGSTENVIRVLDIINKNKYHFNSILLANELINIKQNRQELAQKIFEKFDTYNKNIQIAIIKFLSKNPHIDEISILDKLVKKTLDTDVRCEIMRYFQENKTESAKRYLIKQLTKNKIMANDLNIKGIGTLGYYDDDEVIDLLKALTKSTDELIKESAYKSLEKIQNLQKEKIKIVI